MKKLASLSWLVSGICCNIHLLLVHDITISNNDASMPYLTLQLVWCFDSVARYAKMNKI